MSDPHSSYRRRQVSVLCCLAIWLCLRVALLFHYGWLHCRSLFKTLFHLRVSSAWAGFRNLSRCLQATRKLQEVPVRWGRAGHGTAVKPCPRTSHWETQEPRDGASDTYTSNITEAEFLFLLLEKARYEALPKLPTVVLYLLLTGLFSEQLRIEEPLLEYTGMGFRSYTQMSGLLR